MDQEKREISKRTFLNLEFLVKPEFPDKASVSGELDGMCGPSHCMWGQRSGRIFTFSSIWTVASSSRAKRVGSHSSQGTFNHSTYSEGIWVAFSMSLRLAENFSKGLEQSLTSFRLGFNCAKRTNCAKAVKVCSALCNGTSWMLLVRPGRRLLGCNLG